MRKILILLVCWPYWLSAQNEPIKKALDSFLKSEPMQHAHFSLLVSDGAGNELLAIEPNKSVVPASTLKLLTTATALEVLGSEFSFVTTLAYDGKIDRGRLQGNLYLVGGGDPAFGSDRFGKFYTQPPFLDQMVKAVLQAGIRQIDGRLIADASLYGQYQTPGTWTWEDLGNYWGAQPSALSVYDNSYTAYFRTGAQAGSPSKMENIVPAEVDIDLKNHVLAGNVRSDNAFLFGAPFQSERYAEGLLPLNKANYPVRGSLPDPPALLNKLLLRKLIENNVQVQQAAEVHYLSEPERKLHEIWRMPSPNLQMLVLTTNLRSVNLYAEHMLRHIGLKRSQSAALQPSLDAMEQFWAEKGMNTRGMHLYDGSGLSRYNSLTPRQMIFVLNYMARTAPNNFYFRNSLPVMGKTGTLQYMGRGTPCENRVRAKTGTMNQIRTYAGYLSTKSNRELSFFLAINQYEGKTEDIRQGVLDLLSAIIDTL